jgi:DHA2 family multidrug resistance protein-like MFS transporter
MTYNHTRKAGRREWTGLATLSLACLVLAMDLSVLYLAVPQLSADLEPSSTQLLWIVDVYGFLLAGFLITMGTLGDRIGRRRLLMIGAGAFGATSVLAAFSTSAEMLIAARALLGVAGATLMPSTLSLIRNMFHDPQQRTTAISVWAMSLSLGGAIGPLIGGALIQLFWWGSVFLIAVPVVALLLLVGPRLLTESRDPDARRLDLISAALSLVAVLAVIYGLKRLAASGVETAAILSVVVGPGLVAVFVARQRRLANPLIDLDLFRKPAFSVSLATNTLGLFVFIGFGLFTAQFMQLVLGLSPIQAGLWELLSFAGLMLGSLLAPLFVRRARPAWVMSAGLAVAAIGFTMLTQVEAGSGLALVVTGAFVFSAGYGPVFTLANDLIVASAPPERAGAASGISETATELGGALGVAVLGSIGSAVYRSEIANAVPPDIPTHAADAARDTLGGAIGASDQLPASVIDAAGQAFAQGLTLAAGISAAVMAALALLVAIYLREAPAGSTPHTTEDSEHDPPLSAAATSET